MVSRGSQNGRGPSLMSVAGVGMFVGVRCAMLMCDGAAEAAIGHILRCQGAISYVVKN